MDAYEFYVVNDGHEEPDLIAILPERRKDRRRITQKSIMKLGQLAVGGYVDPFKIYFNRIALDDWLSQPLLILACNYRHRSLTPRPGRLLRISLPCSTETPINGSLEISRWPSKSA